MFKPLLVASLTLSSLAMAEPGRFRPAPVPQGYGLHDDSAPVPEVYRPHDDAARAPEAYRPGEAPFPRPAQEGPSFGHDRPWSEGASFGRPRQDDRLDALRANQLLREYDAALAGRDFRAARATQWSFSAFLGPDPVSWTALISRFSSSSSS
jgi:hypothetical protein